jgi:O-antigen/teichoic acid export membrane protein
VSGIITRLRAALGGGALAGGALLLASSLLVNAGNYLFNLILGRWLGPAAFAELSLVVTLMLVLTLVTGTAQTVAARFAAIYVADGDRARLEGLYRWGGRLTWAAGFALALALALATPALADLFQLSTPWPLLILAAGLPIYFAQGIDRGMLQGATRFGALALSYQAEMWVRLLGGVALVALGLSVAGATLAVSLSFAAAWLAAWLAWRSSRGSAAELGADERRAVLAFAGPAGLTLAGQIVINNSDLLLVKALFAPEQAGMYAALALVGRIVFFATWSVVMAIFPIVAQRHRRGEPHAHLLFAGLGLVAGASGTIILGTLLAPEPAVRLLFGAAYLPIAPLLWLYALATGIYAMANVVVSYRLALGAGGGAVLTLAAGAAQVLGITLFHADLRQVVLVQVVVMGGLLAALLARDGLRVLRAHPRGAAIEALAGRIVGLLLAAGLVAGLVFGGTERATAQPTGPGAEAQRQVKLAIPSLLDSEAERASGAYVPGMGATFALELLRGPNTVPGQPGHVGTRDWAIYLLQTFGPPLTAVPPQEQIALSVEYYSFRTRSYHQLVVVSKAATVRDPATYTVWLDGKPYAEAAREGRP